MTSSTISLPTYSIASGKIDFNSLSDALPMLKLGLVFQIIRKNGGRWRSASHCSRHDCWSSDLLPPCAPLLWAILVYFLYPIRKRLLSAFGLKYTLTQKLLTPTQAIFPDHRDSRILCPEEHWRPILDGEGMLKELKIGNYHEVAAKQIIRPLLNNRYLLIPHLSIYAQTDWSMAQWSR